ncbi:MAG: hypothetical protein SOX32_01820 [Candidatus Choladocola sp.]|nr:hypothetical protein [Candidatus Choladocola sp.]
MKMNKKITTLLAAAVCAGSMVLPVCASTTYSLDEIKMSVNFNDSFTILTRDNLYGAEQMALLESVDSDPEEELTFMKSNDIYVEGIDNETGIFVQVLADYGYVDDMDTVDLEDVKQALEQTFAGTGTTMTSDVYIYQHNDNARYLCYDIYSDAQGAGQVYTTIQNDYSISFTFSTYESTISSEAMDTINEVVESAVYGNIRFSTPNFEDIFIPAN